MNLSTRIGRIEASTASQVRHVEIIAADEADAYQQIEDAILSAGPGRLVVTVTIDGQTRTSACEILPHEDSLELLR